MAIIRGSRPDKNFYILDKTISEDKRLSWGARGLLVYLLGKPDHWRVSTAALINETAGTRIHSGRDAVRAFLSELLSVGYLTRTPARDESGKIAGYDYFVSETCTPPGTDNPGTVPGTDYPATAEPAPANPRLVSTDSKQGLSKAVRIEAGAPPTDPAVPPEVEPATAPAEPPLAKPAAAAANRKGRNSPPVKAEVTASDPKSEVPLVKDRSVNFLMAKGVDYQVAVDWMVARKTKAVTPTVWSLITEEADKAGITPVEAVKWACSRGYASFEGEWHLKASNKAAAGSGSTTYQVKPNILETNRAALAAHLAEREKRMAGVAEQVKDMGEVEQVSPQQQDIFGDNTFPA
jgi:hypothetical protein